MGAGNTIQAIEEACHTAIRERRIDSAAAIRRRPSRVMPTEAALMQVARTWPKAAQAISAAPAPAIAWPTAGQAIVLELPPPAIARPTLEQVIVLEVPGQEIAAAVAPACLIDLPAGQTDPQALRSAIQAAHLAAQTVAAAAHDKAVNAVHPAVAHPAPDRAEAVAAAAAHREVAVADREAAAEDGVAAADAGDRSRPLVRTCSQTALMKVKRSILCIAPKQHANLRRSEIELRLWASVWWF